MNKLKVYWETETVGTLWLDEQRRFCFLYDTNWTENPSALPLSVQLPLSDVPYLNDISRPFFSNLLPEADIRKMLQKKYSISEGNDFGLLSEIGGECAGAISILPEDQVLDKNGSYKELNIAELDAMIKNIPQRPMILQEGARLSLAGAQNKLPVFIRDNKFFLPIGAKSSSHIVKPQINDYPSSVENEAFCMLLAKKIGLAVPEVFIWKTNVSKAYVIKRYDRKPINNYLKRIHQEDFCQALGINAEQKYEKEGGPSFKKCFELLNNKSSFLLGDKSQLIYWAIFNVLIGNSDAHAKNISLIFESGNIRLAPFYDLMSTMVYEGLDTRMAMKIGGYYERENLSKRHWGRFAEDADAKPQIIFSMIENLIKSIRASIEVVKKDFVIKYGESDIVDKIIEIILKECSRTEFHLKEGIA